MLLTRYSLCFLLSIGLFSLLSKPSIAAEFARIPGAATQAGKGKKGDAPPRPRPKPGPRDGGDDD